MNPVPFLQNLHKDMIEGAIDNRSYTRKFSSMKYMPEKYFRLELDANLWPLRLDQLSDEAEWELVSHIGSS